jgi:hypothetical protein
MLISIELFLIFFQAAQTVFCTLWDVSVTQQQVERAWQRLVNELNLKTNESG